MWIWNTRRNGTAHPYGDCAVVLVEIPRPARGQLDVITEMLDETTEFSPDVQLPLVPSLLHAAAGERCCGVRKMVCPLFWPWQTKRHLESVFLLRKREAPRKLKTAAHPPVWRDRHQSVQSAILVRKERRRADQVPFLGFVGLWEAGKASATRDTHFTQSRSNLVCEPRMPDQSMTHSLVDSWEEKFEMDSGVDKTEAQLQRILRTRREFLGVITAAHEMRGLEHLDDMPREGAFVPRPHCKIIVTVEGAGRLLELSPKRTAGCLQQKLMP